MDKRLLIAVALLGMCTLGVQAQDKKVNDQPDERVLYIDPATGRGDYIQPFLLNPSPPALTKAGTNNDGSMFIPTSKAIARSMRQQPVVELPKGAPDPPRSSVPPPDLYARGGPDAFGYRWIDSDQPGGPPFNWINIRGVGTQITGLGDDTNVGPFPIGFTFPFYGNNYTQVRFCTNGFLSFTSTSTAFTNTAIPTTAAPNDALYPFWDDMLFSATNGATAWYLYDAANNRFIIQYDSVPFFSGPGRNTFQVILKPNGDILYQYLLMTGAVNSATVGIENLGGTVALQVAFNAPYLHDNLAVLILRLDGRGGPDAFGYRWIDGDQPGGPSFNWINIRGVGTQITGLGDDTNVGPFPIGFTFPFYGNNYTQIRFCTNGFLSFTSTSAAFSNTAIPTTFQPNDALYPFWDDLRFDIPAGGTAWYYYDAANQRFIIQYDSVPFFSGPGRNTFQVILKPNGDIIFQYLRMTGTVSSATHGIENLGGTVALQVAFNVPYVHDSLAVLILSPLAGTYTIGTGGTHATLSAAVADLQSRAVSAPVTFLFTQASYTDTGQIIGSYPGQSETNTVTFKPASGITARILFTGGSTANTFAVRMDSAVGVTWDGSNSGGTDRSLTLECDTIAPSRNVFLVRKGSHHLTFKNMILKGNRRSTTSSFDVFRMDNQTFAASGPQHHNTVDNCHLLRGLGGIFSRGANGAVLDHDLTFTRNLIGGGDGAPLLDNLAGTGVLLEANRNVLVDQNDINGIKVVGTPQGARIQGANDGVTFTRNKVHNVVTLSGAFRPLCLLIGNIITTGPAVKTRAYVANNMFYDIHNFGTGASARSVDGIIYNPTGPPNSANGNGSRVEFYNNTWHIDYATGEGTGNINFIFDGNFAGSNTTPGHSDSIVFVNNVVSSRRADGLASYMFLMFREVVPGNFVVQSNYNDFYFNSGFFSQRPDPWPGGAGIVFDSTLAHWQAGTGLDANSVFGDPRFVSATNAHIRNDVATPVESRATPIAGLTTDIDGDARNATTPDIGADEGVFIPYVLGTVSAAFDSTTARVNLAWAAPTAPLRQSDVEFVRAVGGQRTPDGPALGQSAQKTTESPAVDGELSDALAIEAGGLLRELSQPIIKNYAMQQQTRKDVVRDESIHGFSEVPSNDSRSNITAFDRMIVAESSELDAASEIADREIASSLPVMRLDLPPLQSVGMGEEADASLTLLRFRIYRSVAGGSFTLIDSVGASATSYGDSLIQARLHSYYLVAVFDDGSSQPSATVSVDVPFVRREVEPNNTAGTANYVTAGYGVNASLGSTTDADWFRFSVAAGHLVVDGTDGSNTTDVVLDLYDSTGALLLYHVDRNINDRLEFNVPYSGVYFVRVTGYLGATGPYTMFARIDTPTDPREPDDGPLFGFPLIATQVTPPHRDTVATINPGVGLPGFDLDYRWLTASPGFRVTAILRTRTTFPSSTLNGGYIAIGRKGQPASLFPDVFGGSPLVQGFSTTGTDVSISFNVTVADTYYVFASVHLRSPGFGLDQAGPNARYDVVIDRPTRTGEVTELPTVYALGQNYPNPFNPSTQIQYALPKASSVTLKVFNVLGQEVATLLNAEQAAGYHAVTWHGRNSFGNTVSSGMYFYRIDAKSKEGGEPFVRVKKMMLLK